MKNLSSIHADTLITMADKTTKPVRELKKGDKVLAWNNETFIPDTVKDITPTTAESVVKAYNARSSIICSNNHRFACATNTTSSSTNSSKPRYRKIKDMSPTTYVVFYEQEKNRALYSKIRREPWQAEDFYDLETENLHNYIANNFIVHNSNKSKKAKVANPISKEIIATELELVKKLVLDLRRMKLENDLPKTLTKWIFKQGIGLEKFYNLCADYRELGQLHKEINYLLGENLWERAVDGRANWNATKFRLHRYSQEMREDKEYNESLKAKAEAHALARAQQEQQERNERLIKEELAKKLH